jgi:hypothetical protein
VFDHVAGCNDLEGRRREGRTLTVAASETHAGDPGLVQAFLGEDENS